MPRSLTTYTYVSVGHRRRHVGPVLKRPHDVRRRHVATSARPHREHRPLAARRNDELAVHDRRCDDAIGEVVRGIQRIGAPQLFAGIDVVTCHRVAAGDDELEVRAVREQSRAWCTNPATRAARSSAAPTRQIVRPFALLMRSTYDGSSVFIPCSTCTIQRIAVQHRRRSVAPVQAELSVVLLDVAHPQLFAAEVERLQDAGARHHPHVSCRR